MNVKISMSVISVEAIMYLLLYNFHDRTFKINTHFSTCFENLGFSPVVSFF